MFMFYILNLYCMGFWYIQSATSYPPLLISFQFKNWSFIMKNLLWPVWTWNTGLPIKSERILSVSQIHKNMLTFKSCIKAFYDIHDWSNASRCMSNSTKLGNINQRVMNLKRLVKWVIGCEMEISISWSWIL